MRRYNEWWSKNEAARRRVTGDRIEKRGTAFRVEYSRYVKERIERRALTVNRDGTVSDVR